MNKEDLKEHPEEIKTSGMTRRDFLRNAGVLMGTTAVGSMAILSACNGGDTVTKTETKTVTTTASGGSPTTITTTVTSPPVTKTVTAATEDGEVAEAIIRLNINGNESQLW